MRNYHSRSSVVRDDEAIKLWQKRKKFDSAKLRISRVAKTSEIRKKFFPGSSLCRCRPGLLSSLVLRAWVSFHRDGLKAAMRYLCNQSLRELGGLCRRVG